ncbi:MAG: HEAT repeat domain-containing protein [Deltaproteobacteria bacterium]|nr:MAG: HEAT repeat domain-containing protein [Deltaproteobacteria bacterium]
MEKYNRKWRGRNLKRKVLDLLRAEDISQALETIGSLPPRQVINPLFSFLCSTEPQVKWRAVKAIGEVVKNIAEKDMESARVIMRRMIWNLNDESGGIGWGLPEAMGEVMAQHHGLANEYVMILKSYIQEDGNFLEYQPLQRGVLWGLGRLAQERPELLKNATPHLRPFLSSADVVLRGLAAWTMGLLVGSQGDPALAPLESDETEVVLYLNGTERSYRISELARKALAADV